MTELPLEILTFETWYAKFPRKVGKGAARTAYAKAMKSAFPGMLHKAVEAFAAIENERTGYQTKKGKSRIEALEYCCHPATWLRQERWDDEPIREWLERPEVKPPEPVVIPEDINWYKERKALLEILGDVKYRAWFEDMNIWQDNKIWVQLPTQFVVDHVRNNWSAEFEQVFKTTVRFVPSPTPQTD